MSNSNLRRMMMAQKPSAPSGDGIVTDGLILWLDGLDRGGDPGYWIDKVAGRKFQLFDVVENDSNVMFSGSSKSFGILNDPTLETLDSGTFECATNWEPARNDYGVLFNAGRGEFNVGPFGDGMIWSASSKPEYRGMLRRNVDTTFSITSSYGYSNKIKCPASGSDHWSPAVRGVFVIGNKQGGANSQYRGRIYSIRVYDRILTEAEILQNQQYDIDTYFGGVIPE